MENKHLTNRLRRVQHRKVARKWVTGTCHNGGAVKNSSYSRLSEDLGGNVGVRFIPWTFGSHGCRNVFLPGPKLQFNLLPQSCAAALSNYPRVQSAIALSAAARILSNSAPSPPLLLLSCLICVTKRYLD